MIVMNSTDKRRKGQSAIEYLTTYGWALLAIVIVGAVLMNMGVFSQCQKAQPRFSGQQVALDTWQFTANDTLSLELTAINEDVNVTNVEIGWDSGDTWTASPNQQIAAGTSDTVSVNNSDALASGSCANGDLSLSFNVGDITGAEASGSGSLTATVPG